LPPDELRELYAREAGTHAEELALEEGQRFYNHPSANADLGLWAKKAYWTLDEAVALTLSKNPEVVSWAKLKDWQRYPLVEQYRIKFDLVSRAKVMSQLFDPTGRRFMTIWSNKERKP
jgi:hypothetical protein